MPQFFLNIPLLFCIRNDDGNLLVIFVLFPLRVLIRVVFFGHML